LQSAPSSSSSSDEEDDEDPDEDELEEEEDELEEEEVASSTPSQGLKWFMSATLEKERGERSFPRNPLEGNQLMGLNWKCFFALARS